MTKLLDEAVRAARQMPEEDQDAIARVILNVFVERNAVDDDGIEPISEEHREAVLEGLAQAERGEFATDEEVAAIFARLRR